ncbi:unnamed protein product, partial [Rotaria sp. Silwood1]
MPIETSIVKNADNIKIVQITKTEGPLESGNTPREQAIENVDDIIPALRSSTVKVQHVRKLSNNNQDINSEAVLPQELRVLSTSSTKNHQVTVTKIPRTNTAGTQSTPIIDAKLHDHEKNQQNVRLSSNTKSANVTAIRIINAQPENNHLNSSVNQRARSSSISTVNVQKLKRAATKLQSTVNHSKPNMSSTTNKIKTFNKVGVPWLDLQYHDANRKSIKEPHVLEYDMKEPPDPINEKILDRIQGSIIGTAIGDALGAHVEFKTHQFLIEHPVTDFQSGGSWSLSKGQ